MVDGICHWSMHRRVRASACFAALVAALVGASGAEAAGGGLKPSQAPLVTVGQQFFGTTASETSDTQIEYWKLPPLMAQDTVTVAWNDRDTSGATRMCLAQNVDDYNFGEQECDEVNSYDTSYGSARSFIEIPVASSASFLKFYKRGLTCCGDGGPYDFVIEAIQHRVGVSLAPVGQIARNGALHGSANLTDGTPVPDGLAFVLTARWKERSFGRTTTQQAQYNATSVAGRLTFQLGLPTSAEGRKVTFVVTRSGDAAYAAAKSVPLKAPVVAPTVVPNLEYRSCVTKARKTARRRVTRAKLRWRGAKRARKIATAHKRKRKAIVRCGVVHTAVARIS